MVSRDFLQILWGGQARSPCKIQASLPPNPGINEWFPPANTIFARSLSGQEGFLNWDDENFTRLCQLCLLAYNPIYACMYTYYVYNLSIYLSVCLSICLSIYLSIYLFVHTCIYIYDIKKIYPSTINPTVNLVK